MDLEQTWSKNEQFASTLADPKSRFRSTTSATRDKARIQNYLAKPAENFAAISALMRDMVLKNGVVGKAIDYYQSHPTYNHSIYPLLGSNKNYKFDGNMSEDFIDVAYGLETLNIPFFAPYFVKRTLIDGVAFFYKVQDSKGVAYMEFPQEWCRIYVQEQGVYRFMIDMSKIKKEIGENLPNELKSAFENYSNKNGLDNDKKWYDKKWYYVSDKGVAFCFDQGCLLNGGVAVSPFAGLLLDGVALDKAKANVDIKDVLDATRIIHSKIPTNNEGIPTLNIKTARLYDQQMRDRLPEGVVAVTSPNNLTNVSLVGSGNSKVYETVNKGMEQIFYDLGISSSLFGGNTTSSNIVKEAIKKDANWIYNNVFPVLNNYYGYELTKIKTKSKVKWGIKFVRQSNFTLDTDLKNAKEQLTLGGSRLDYMAANGLSPIEVYSKLLFEQQVLDIDSLMVVKPTSHTTSGTENEGSGRPKTDNPSDDTDRIENAS